MAKGTTIRRARNGFILCAALLSVAAAAPGAAAGCLGDCDGNAQVTLSEVISGQNIALGAAPLSSCPAFDIDGDGKVGVAELTRAVGALGGCANGPLPPITDAGTAVVHVGSTAGAPGQTVSFDVTLETGGLEVAGVQNDTTYDPLAPIAAKLNGRPDCTVNPAIDKDGSIFVFQPSGCTPGSDCTAVQALVLAFDNVLPIPDGAVMYSCNVAIDPSAPAGVYPLTSSNEGAADPNGGAIPASGESGIVLVGPPPTCGNGLLELDEQCDDANTVGGDGCAANCTLETTHGFLFEPGLSGISVQTAGVLINLGIAGQVGVTTGAPRLTDPTAQVPAVIKAANVNVDPISVPGLACVCLRGVDTGAFGPGNSGHGVIGCGASGLAPIDAVITQDHDIGDIDPGCMTGTIEGPGDPHPGVCNGPPITTRSGSGPRGSSFVQNTMVVGLLQDNGACSTAGPVGGSCPFPDYGPDCLPCTGDDAGASEQMSVGLTTGSASAVISDADDQLGTTIAPGALCAGSPCVANAVGTPLTCGAFDVPGPLLGGTLVTAFPQLDFAFAGDNVVTVHLVNGATIPPTPTPTFTPTASATPTTTASATATATTAPTAHEAPASLILRRARLRVDTSDRRDRGWVRLAGAVSANAPFGNFVADIAADGLTLMMSTSLGQVQELSWSAAQCTSRSSSRGPRIECEAEDAVGHRKISFRPMGTPNVFDLKLLARQLGFAPPLGEEPVRVSLTTTSFRRSDEIGNCVVRDQGNLKSCRESGILPTPTLTASATGTATSTDTSTPTITLTPTVTDTPTITPTVTPTATSTPVVVPTVELGERVFTIEPGIPVADSSTTRTGLFTSGLSGSNAALSFSSGPLTLVGGLPDPSGVASLALKEDVTLTVSIIDGTYVCLKLIAAGSSGSIDCDGGTPYDVEATQPPGDVGPGFTLQTGLGAPGAPGNGDLILMQQVQRIPVGPVPDCSAIVYDDPPQLFAYTTTTATAVKGSLQLAIAGEPFDCNHFTQPGTGGLLAAPVPATFDPIGDVANVFRLGERAAAERTFTIDPGTLFSTPDFSGTGFFTSGLATANAASSISPGPLSLVLGASSANGIAPLRLKNDVALSVDIFDGTCLCIRLLAAGSTGSIDCDGGTAYDTQAVEALDPSDPWTVTTGLGSPAGAGNGDLLITGQYDRLFEPCAAADCEHRTYVGPLNLFSFTTTNATAVAGPGGSLTLAAPGGAFSCANFAVPGSGGALATGMPFVLDPVGDAANVLRLAEVP